MKKQTGSSKESQKKQQTNNNKVNFDVKAEKLQIEFRRPSLKSPAAEEEHAQDAEEKHDVILGEQEPGKQRQQGKLTSAI